MEKPPEPTIPVTKSPSTGESGQPVVWTAPQVMGILVAVFILCISGTAISSLFKVMPVIRENIGGIYEVVGSWFAPFFLHDGMVWPEEVGALMVLVFVLGVSLPTVLFLVFRLLQDRAALNDA
jgi:hypothetical protein